MSQIFVNFSGAHSRFDFMLQQHFSVLVIEIQDGKSHPAFRSPVEHGYGGHSAARFQSFEDHHSWFDVAGWLQTSSDFFLFLVPCISPRIISGAKSLSHSICNVGLLDHLILG